MLRLQVTAVRTLTAPKTSLYVVHCNKSRTVTRKPRDAILFSHWVLPKFHLFTIVVKMIISGF